MIAAPRLIHATIAAIAVLAGSLLPACRGTLGAHCRCASDCRSGLLCAAEGAKALAGELCYDAGMVGECVEALEVDTDGGTLEIPTEPPMYLDLPSKRDFQPGMNPSSVSDTDTGTGTDTGTDTGTGTEPASTGTGTGSESSGTTSTSTGSTGTSTTGDTSTGTSTTGTTSGTTTSDTTGGTTSATTGGSSGSTG